MTTSVVRTALQRWDVQLAVATTLIVQMGISIISASTPIVAPAVAVDRGWNVTLVALYPIAAYGTAFLVSFCVPFILLRIGGIALNMICLAASAIGILFLLAPNPLVILVVPVVLGFALGAMNPASSQILGSRMSADNAGLIMSVKSTGIPVGIMLAGVAIPPLVAWFGWQGAILRVSLAAAILFVALLPSIHLVKEGNIPSATAKAQRSLDPIKRLLGIPGMKIFLIAAGIFGAMMFCLRTFFVAHLVTHVRLSLTAAGLAFSVSQIAGVVGQLIWAPVSDRMLTTPATMTIVGTLMTVAALLTAIMGPDWPMTWIVAIAACYGLSAGGFFPLVLAEVARRSANGEAGPATAAAQIFLIPINVSGPLVFGAIANIADFPVAFAAIAACTLAASILVGTQRRS